MTWFHGTIMCDLEVGDRVLPASKHGGYFNNPRRVDFPTVEEYDDGQQRDEHDVVWICADRNEAAGWGSSSILKMTGADVRAEVRRRGRDIRHLLLEVEPVGPVFRRLDPHSPTEAACAEAVITHVEVVEEYPWQDFYERGANGEAVDPYTGSEVHLDSPDE